MCVCAHVLVLIHMHMNVRACACVCVCERERLRAWVRLSLRISASIAFQQTRSMVSIPSAMKTAGRRGQGKANSEEDAQGDGHEEASDMLTPVAFGECENAQRQRQTQTEIDVDRDRYWVALVICCCGVL